MKCMKKNSFLGGLLVGSVLGAVAGGLFVSKGKHEVVDNAKTLYASVSDGLNEYRDIIDRKILEIELDQKKTV